MDIEDTSLGEKDNILFRKLRKLINLIDQLRDCGVQEYIKLPRIASLGTQSAGKSSVLESIVGLDFLPRGDGVVTRRPLELRLTHIETGDPWAVFEERKGQKFTDFNKVRETIEILTDEICKKQKNIINKPIILTVYSQTCPDLTLIDLPGITRVPVGDQPPNIEEITKDMARFYCDDPLTIILCVIAANSDIATSDGLKMAKEIDRQGSRTIGVLTKMDIMDQGTDARRALLGEEIYLKLGYVGVKNRSKQDLVDKIPMKEAIKKEKDYFNSHKIYKKMPPGYLGTDVLIQKLTKILFKIIREHLPGIIKGINDNIKKCEEQLSLLGEPMPTDDAGKLSLLWNMLIEYCAIYKNVLRGKYDSKRLSFLKDEGGYKIKEQFKGLLEEFGGDYKATAGYTDEKIHYALTIHEGDSIPGFPSVDAFYYLLRPELEKLREPINDCFQNVFAYLDMLSYKILEKTFCRFPSIISDIAEFVSVFLNEEKAKAKYIVDSIVEMEINYLFTNDEEYMQNYTTFLPKERQMTGHNANFNTNTNTNPNANVNSNSNINSNSNMNNNIFQNPPKQEDTKALFIKEIRNRIEAYFKLIVRNLRDSIPKVIGNNLVRSIEETMQIKLYNSLYKSDAMISLLNEPEEVTRLRIELNNQIKVMKDAQKIIRRDPEYIYYFNHPLNKLSLMQVMQININDTEIAGTEFESLSNKDNGNKSLSGSNSFKSDNTSSIKTSSTNPNAKKNLASNLFGKNK